MEIKKIHKISVPCVGNIFTCFLTDLIMLQF